MSSKRPEFCEAVTRMQFEATTWGAAHLGCSRKPVAYDERSPSGWFCRQHSDPKKRYGVNRGGSISLI